MKDSIATGIARLAGTRLMEFANAAGLQLFTFTQGGAELRLHVSCPWRVVSASGIQLGSGDYGRNDLDPEWVEEGDTSNSGLLRERTQDLQAQLEEKTYEVLRVTSDDVGGLHIQLSSQLTIDVFPNASDSGSSDVEFWRLFQEGMPEVVVSSEGIDYVTDV